MNTFELLPEGSIPRVSGAQPLVWPAAAGATSTVVADVNPWLGRLGPVPTPAIDLVRIAAGAYMADRLSPRGQGFSRTIELHVQLADGNAWSGHLDLVANLLSWLTADEWLIEIADDALPIPNSAVTQESRDVVALLSGGLDSLCGAVLGSDRDVLYLGHWDSPTVKGAQNAVRRWLENSVGHAFEYEQIRLNQAQSKREPSSRSRAFLFMALAVATALGRGASTIDVPENGFTSLNPPLGPERSGALSTRSTHPTTVQRLNDIVGRVGLPIRVNVRHAHMTKGELVSSAAAAGPPDFSAGVAASLSCGKLDGARYRGGNPNHHCGLCFPCLIRRAAVSKAGVPDLTPYLTHTLQGNALAKLRHNRRADVDAVRRAVLEGFSDVSVLALGPFPTDFDLDSAVDLCERGLAELARLNLA